MKKINRNNIKNLREFWFSLYNEETGVQFGFSCIAKDEEQAIRKMHKECGKNIGIADCGAYDEL